MSVSLDSVIRGSVPMNEMADGQLGVIVSNNYSGTVVQMLRGKPHATIKTDVVVSVGEKNGKTWGNPMSDTIRVRLLEPGEIIKVTGN